jgi:co-chaperonin GroES (HSP10)
MVKPMPAFFLISIPRIQQTERKSKIGNLYLHPNFVYMTRGMQCGKIVSIGSKAAASMPQAKIGDTLLVHHFVESSEKQNCVASDDLYNYYVVTCMSHNGQNNQTYAVFDGKDIIPHPDYIFLECTKAAPRSETPEDYLDNNLKKTSSGLFLFKQWTIDREGIVERIKELKEQIGSLTKPGMNMTADVAKAVKQREEEMDRLSAQLNKKRIERFIVAAINPDFSDDILQQWDCRVSAGDMVYMLNIACETKMEFNGKEYIVAKSMHFSAPASWVHKHLSRELAS